MAKIIDGGEPVNDSERAVIRHLRDHGPDDWYFWHNIDVPLQDGRKGDIDILLVTGHAIYLIDVKGTHGRIEVARRRWYPSNGQSFYSPVEKLRNHCRAFKGHLQRGGMDSRVYVDQMVVLTAPDAHLIDHATGTDTDAMHVITGLDNLITELARPPQVTGRFFRDIGQYRAQIIAAVDGAVEPRTGPKLFGHWEVIESLGESSERAEVTEYRARNASIQGSAAASVLLRVYRADPFQDEAARATQLHAISNGYQMLERVRSHDCVVPCRDFFPNEDESQYVLVLEDVSAGALLLRLTDPQAGLTTDGKLRVIRDMLRGLAYAHANGVLHRALSPATVLVTSAGGAMLTGFDYARPVDPRSPSRSVVDRLPEVLDEVYVAPECQRNPHAMTKASDVYAAGVIAFHLLTGEPPFASSVDQYQRDSVLPSLPMAAAGLAQPVTDLLRRMCARNPADRPTAATALEALTAAPAPRPENQRRGYRSLPPEHKLTRKYTVVREIGHGSFGVVYQVYDNMADADRAVKIVDQDHVSLEGRTLQEYRTLLRLPPHPNVVKVENADYLPDQVVPYLVFEYLDGRDVHGLVKDRALGPADTRRLGIDVASGLKFLHDHGVCHCDIKPRNLMWTGQGCKIIDFNVSVSTDTSLSRAGGTAKYAPPDRNPAAPVNISDLMDRDVYGLGVTLYEVLTGEYPFPPGGPTLGDRAADPRERHARLKDLSDEFTAVLLKAIEPLRGGRYASAAEFLAALKSVTEVHRKAVPEPADVCISLPAPAAPNVNPFVTHLQSLYSQSPSSNAGTRGSDKDFRTYVTTALDENLVPDVLNGTFRLVIITGNAGDGKTAFLENLVAAAVSRGGQPGSARANGTDITLPGGRVLRTNNDGSQDEGDRANDDVLGEFFGPFADGAEATGDIRLIAINEGRLIDFLSVHGQRFGALTQTVEDGLAGQPPAGDIAVVNLNQRSLVAPAGGDGTQQAIFDRVVGQLTREPFWAACEGCDLVRRCYAPHNARTFAHPSAGPKIIDRLRDLYRLVHLRGQLHITLRDLRSAIAFMLTSGRDCAQIHELYSSGAAEDILASYYFNSWLGVPGGVDRLLRLLRELDIAAVPDPALDGKLSAIGPTADQGMMTIDQRGTYDIDLLSAAFERMRSGDQAGTDGPANAARYLGPARRRFYFESIDADHARTGLPFKSAERFLAWLAEPGSLKERLPELVAAINQGEGLPDTAMADGGLALATRDVPGGTILSYRVFPRSALALSAADSPASRYVEGEPDGLELAANGATLRIRLDLFELLDRQLHGYLPGAAELQGRHLDLIIFKNKLSATPYQEVVLTTGGPDAHRIRREPDGRLVMTALTQGGTTMALNHIDRDFRHEGVSYLDYKQIEMDRVLTAFLARLWWSGQSSVISRDERTEVTTDLVIRMMTDAPERFQDFDPVVTRRWVETHLLDMVSRGKSSQAVAGLRPLHGFTYRFRNARRSRAYNADEQLYEMLSHAGEKGRYVLAQLKDFFFAGVDPHTEAPRLGDDVDVETQALISLSEILKLEITDRASGARRRSCPPLYAGASELLADDIVRLLYHRNLIPRTVLVDYLKILFAFHLALYQLTIMKLLPAMVREGRPLPPGGGFFLDVTDLPGSAPARLAERSAATWYDRIPAFVAATFTVKKLNDLADHLAKRNPRLRPAGGFQVSDLLPLLGTRYQKERKAYADARLIAIDTARAPGEDDPVVTQLLQLGMDEFTTYIEVITHYRVGFHRRFLIDCLDSLLLKNRPGAMIAQPRLGARRFTLDSRMLEVLLQLALLRGTEDNAADLRTSPLRVDEFLGILRDRYGLHIDELPAGDGFGSAIVTEHAALRENRDAFIARLREIGFYSDLSDAYLTQTITPRYTIGASA